MHAEGKDLIAKAGVEPDETAHAPAVDEGAICCSPARCRTSPTVEDAEPA